MASNLISSFSLNPKKSKKVTSTYYYVSRTPYQRLLFGTGIGLPIERSMDYDPNYPPYFKRLSSWTSSTVSFTPTSDFTKYIGSISFAEDFLNNTGYDGSLSLQEAINAIYDYFIANQAIPATIIVDGSVVISITPATAAH